MNICEEIKMELFSCSDTSYKEFTAPIIPTVNPDKIIGVRVPILRQMAKRYVSRPEINEFLDTLPHEYLEENHLHGFIIALTKDYDVCIKQLNHFLPYVDNWSTCDMIRPKCFAKNKATLLRAIEEWLASDDSYTIRFGIEMLMCHYLDDSFCPDYAYRVAEIISDEYYINMMKAWYFATALAKQYDSIIPILIENRLDTWSHNKTIQKAVESYRITPEQKIYLRTLKRTP